LIFIDAQYSVNDLLVKIFDGQYRWLTWTEFELKEKAMESVVAAQWQCYSLQKLAQATREKIMSFEEIESGLTELRNIAMTEPYKRISIQNPSDPSSVFDD
jgi:uncharacterized damage-inducible protein DinB